MVQEKALNARAAERVYEDLMETPLTRQSPALDPAALDAQLAQLKAQAGKIDMKGD